MKNLKKLLKNESFPGFLLIFCTGFALLCKNTIFSGIYDHFLHAELSVGFNELELSKSLLHWINDGLIAIFFLCIGLELKYEILRGQLKHIKSISLPLFGALGGMLFPALIFVCINYGDDFAMRGWAIPTATDIAFAVGVLMLLGNKVPSALKLFLLSLAIFDDLGAIIIIALFYTSELSGLAIFICVICICVLFVLNFLKVSKLPFYFIIGLVLWVAMLESGVHATLAGVIIALFIPMEKANGEPLLKTLYHNLNPYVIYFILPLFAFANAGIDLRNMEFQALFLPASLGIFLGLFLGKQIGVFLLSYISIKLKLASLPKNINYKQFYGVCILTGIGFTMSLFIDSLAYADNMANFKYADRLAILLASFVSAVVAFVYLKMTHFDEVVK